MFSGFFFVSFCIMPGHNLFAENKSIIHIASLPVIEGLGIYTSVYVLHHSDSTLSRAAAAGNICFLAAGLAGGAAAMFGPEQKYDKIRKLHRILGYAAFTGAGVLSYAVSIDPSIKGTPAQFTAYGYNLAVCFPLLYMRF